VDWIIQVCPHSRELPIREHKAILLVMGASHDLNRLECNGREHHVSSLESLPTGLNVSRDQPYLLLF
jgi:hypothetical protein